MNLAEFTIADVVDLGAQIRECGKGATSMQEVANSIIRVMSEATACDEDEPSLALIRCFMIDAHSRLPQRLARLVPLEDDDDPDGQCLVLVATEGVEPEWCDPRTSARHQVIPLVGSAMTVTFPMITRMFRQFGVPISAIVSRDVDGFINPEQRSFNVFHVEEAAGSSDIPDQGFISDYKVSSVVAVGSPLPARGLFAVLMFSRVPVDRRLAEMLEPLALSMKLAFLPVLERVFSDDSWAERSTGSTEGRLRVEVDALRSLLEVEQRLLCGQYRTLLAANESRVENELTSRENQILQLVATGATNKQIASNLDVGAGTIKWHMYNLFQKLGVDTRTAAVTTAQNRGLLD